MRKVSIPFCFLFLVGLCACRDEVEPIPAPGDFLSGPSVFLPAGILRSPQGIAVDGSGNVWVADTRNNKLRRFSPAGIQTDSIPYPNEIQKVAVDKRNGDLVVIQNATVVDRILTQTKTVIASFPLNPFIGDASAVFDANTRMSRSIAIDISRLGDIDTSPTGDIYVSAHGIPENAVIKIVNGNVSAIASSSLVPSAAADVGPRFLGVDAFGIVYTSFTFPVTSSQNVVRMYSVTPSSITQSNTLIEPVVSGAARGAATEVAGYIYIADPLTQDLVIVSSNSRATVAIYRIPDTNGFSMAPQDVAVTSNGTVYVVVTDRAGSEAGAILKYIRSPQ